MRGTKGADAGVDASAESSAASLVSASSAGSVEAEVETWMIMEYCDKGSLQVCVAGLRRFFN